MTPCREPMSWPRIRPPGWTRSRDPRIWPSNWIHRLDPQSRPPDLTFELDPQIGPPVGTPWFDHRIGPLNWTSSQDSRSWLASWTRGLDPRTGPVDWDVWIMHMTWATEQGPWTVDTPVSKHNQGFSVRFVCPLAWSNLSSHKLTEVLSKNLLSKKYTNLFRPNSPDRRCVTHSG